MATVRRNRSDRLMPSRPDSEDRQEIFIPSRTENEDHEETFIPQQPVHHPDQAHQLRNDRPGSLDVCSFFNQWQAYRAADKRLSQHKNNHLLIAEGLNSLDKRPRQKIITWSHVESDVFDKQGIDWHEFGICPRVARRLRMADARSWYDEHKNCQCPRHAGSKFAETLSPDVTPYKVRTPRTFRFKSLVTTHSIPILHADLRSTISCPSSATTFYASNDTVCKAMRHDPTPSKILNVKDLSRYYQSAWNFITCLKVGYDILVVGGPRGQYAYTNIHAPLDSPFVHSTPVSPFAAKEESACINHIDIFPSRRSAVPTACLSRNTKAISLIDCTINKTIAEHSIPWVANASTASPDARLRLIVGDDRTPIIIDAETARISTPLTQHKDYCFSCAWSEDGKYIATGSDDMKVYIYDTRQWNKPLHVIETVMGGARSLHFAPRQNKLLIVEPFDIVSLVDLDGGAEQLVVEREEFLGEISGAAFIEEGDDAAFVVANGDWRFGGLMEYEPVDRYRRRAGPEDLSICGRGRKAMEDVIF